MGNYLNGGTTKGAAWGFKLDSLNKLIGTKTVDNNSTLLHYLARKLAVCAHIRIPTRRGPWGRLTPPASAVPVWRFTTHLSTCPLAASCVRQAKGVIERLLDELTHVEGAARVVWKDEGAELATITASLKQVEPMHMTCACICRARIHHRSGSCWPLATCACACACAARCPPSAVLVHVHSCLTSRCVCMHRWRRR